MTLLNQLKSKTLQLRKERSSLGPVMQFHLSEVSQIGKNSGNRDTQDDEVIQYLKKTVQKLKENSYSNVEEIVVLESLLPSMATDEQIKEFLSALDLSSMNKGQIMGAVKSHFGVLVDMKKVGTILNDLQKV
jgi:uncharacterized protein YqeY